MSRIQKIAFIGTRGHFSTVLRELPEHAHQRIVAVANGGDGDTAAPILEWDRTQLLPHQPRDFGVEWLRMLDESKPDAVVICGPYELQASMSVAALDRGIHVLVEKPAALSFDDLGLLRAAHRRSPGVHLASMVFSRYSPGFYTAAALVSAGAVGLVRLIESRKSYKLGTRGPHYRDRRTYGGTIPWVGSHAIDWVAWMSGQTFRSVYAAHSYALNDPALGSMERSALCHFMLSGEVVASVAIDVYRPDRAPTHGDDWIRVVGTNGVIEARPGSAQLISAENDGSVPLPVACDRTPWADFIAHAEGRGQAIADAAGALGLADACLRARESADSGRVVHFGEGDAAQPHMDRGVAPQRSKPSLQTTIANGRRAAERVAAGQR
jgi:predicted dehydrogenase